MAKLILSMDGLVLKEIPLTKDRTTIGRRPSNDIQIDNLAISGEHAAVVTILNDSFLEDLNSTNGTLVNGQPVKKHFLKNGDVVELGKYKLKFITEKATSAVEPDYEKTMVLRPADKQPAPKVPEDAIKTGAVPSSPATASLTPVGAIQVLNGANAGRELELTKSMTTLGKPGIQVAVIARRPQGYFITHVEGSTYPSVNGQQLGTQARPLADHDVIEIASIKMEFFLKS